LMSRRREPYRLERARIHLIAETHGHRPERDPHQAADDATEEDESGEVLGANRRIESGDVAADGERRPKEERRDDTLVQRREYLRHDGDAVTREDDEVLFPDGPGGGQLVH